MHPASLDTEDGLEEIVSGVAHDFGNILAVVTNYLSLASRRIADPVTAELLERAQGAAQRAARLTRQLHELGDCGALEVEPVLVDDLVRDVSGVLAESLCERCKLRLDLAAELAAMANRTGLEIVLRHLVQNACDALPDGGLVTIASRSQHGSGATRTVELSVSDAGIGMPPGQAAGLGLTIVARVARRLGGEVQIESIEGSGTTVRLLLSGAAIGG